MLSSSNNLINVAFFFFMVSMEKKREVWLIVIVIMSFVAYDISAHFKLKSSRPVAFLISTQSPKM